MALSRAAQFALAVAFFGVLSFIFGVIAENKKPAAGIPFTKDGITTCRFPKDPTVALGSLSVVSLFIFVVLGYLSVFHSYDGKSVPTGALFQSTSLAIFFGIALSVSALGVAMMMWATLTEGGHRMHNVHHVADYACPTAKTGLFGGAAFLALDASLFWLVSLMLTLNARADYLEDDDPKGEYGEVLATDYDLNGTHLPPPKV
ncbi:hypothetical protein QJS10_CPA05g02488 [Acorus calamus]|uniref:Uncharacterized protein n=1 Tax=Acorus calamus TaxID=4465 RepID=A0AAV9ES84_ACOCL|nr:hypothetical protein QJS10_CPA05g02488 [Acorus calamus]